MVNWHDLDVIEYSLFLYEQIAIFLLGFYGTQFLNTLSVEWELLTRRRAFRLVHAPYLLARYIALAALLFFVITGRVRNRIACDPAYRTFASLGCFAAAFASLLLGSRPAAIFWTLKLRIPLFLLLVLGLGQFGFATLQGVVTIRATWSAEQAMCIVYQWHSPTLAAFYVYTFGYDVVILLMTLYAVHSVQQEQQSRKRWGVGDVLCIQGIGYVVVTCIVNIPVAALAFLDLNAGMDILLSLPAMTISVIASSLTLLSLEDSSQDTLRARSNRARAGSRSATGIRRSHEHGVVTTHIVMTTSMLELDSREVYDGDLATLTAKAQLNADSDVDCESQALASTGSPEDVSTALPVQ